MIVVSRVKLLLRIASVLFVLGVTAAARAQTPNVAKPPRTDQFSAVRCDRDVPRALIGRHTTRDRVVAIEARHQDIQLKNVGGSEASDVLFLGGWAMCGREFQLLESKNQIKDAIEFPAHSRRYPALFGTCRSNGKELKDGVLAILDNPEPRPVGMPPYQPSDTTFLVPRSAWRIDEAQEKFVPLEVRQLRCPRGQIFTVDGGM